MTCNKTSCNCAESDSDHDLRAARRRLLGLSAAGLAGLLVAPGVHLFAVTQAQQPTVEGASSTVRWGLLIDVSQCRSDCSACVSACERENGLNTAERPTDARWIRKIDIRPAHGPQSSMPLMCQHCAHPPCVDVCPTGASFKRADGLVLVDRHRCIGCRYCMMACPFKARSFVHAPLSQQTPDVPRGMGTVESCTLCVHRLDRGEDPACVSACADTGHRALWIGDLNDPHSDISERLALYPSRALREDLRLDPGVRYQGLPS